MEDKIQKKNFDQICRLCLEYASESNNLCPLFMNEENARGYYGCFVKEFKESLPEIIAACIGIKIDATANLPMGICIDCKKTLIVSNQFREKCLLSNDYLMELKLKQECDYEYSDTDDYSPINSFKPPELIFVESIKDESNDKAMDIEMNFSSYDSASNTIEMESNHKSSISTAQSNEIFTEHLRNANAVKKIALKTSTTIPLVTPSTPIVPLVSDTNSCSEESINQNHSGKPIKRNFPKKSKMCTVCGIMVKRLRDHMKNHPDSLEHSCSHCPRKYLTKQGLMKHIDIQHTEDSNQHKSTTEQKRSMERVKKYRGQTYISKNGVVRGGKHIGPPCNEQCVYKCTNQISENHRKHIFDNFYELGSIHRQWQFIARCADRITPKYRRVVQISKRRRNERSLNIAYHFQLNNDKIRVCKTFFLNTLGISNSVTKTALGKCNENGELIIGDRRGAKSKLTE